MTWQITEMPTQRTSQSDHIGWLRHGDIQVKVQIQHQGVTQEDALLIIQNLAGILMLSSTGRDTP